MAVAGVKFASDRGFAANCFPVRYKFGQTSNDASGAWAVAFDAEEQRRFKAVLCAKPRTYSRIKEERKKADLEGPKLAGRKFDDSQDEAVDDNKVLDKLFLMKHCCVEDPADLCSVNIASKELTDVKEDDLLLFENVAYVNAGENFLPFDGFNGFPSLRELEVPLNGLRNLKLSHSDFASLEVLDISYNNLSQDDLLTLGLLTHLRVLHLTGNSFVSLPEDLAMPYLSREKQVRIQRFACLEVLMLDDNKLIDMAVFAALAGLPKLRHLDLSKNEIFFVPQLKLVEGRVTTQDGKVRKRTKRSGSSRKSDRSSKSRSLGDEQDISLFGTKLEREKSAKLVLMRDSEVKPENGGKKHENNELVNEGNANSDLNFQELMTEDFKTGDLSARIEDFVSDNSVQKKTDSMLPPFPELRYLNLADNKIYEEDGLLALAAWPMLEEVDVFKNPLTTENSGDPPLLKKFLKQRLGIKVNRFKPEESFSNLKKGKAEIRPKFMKITDYVSKIPKISLEEKMMLQLPPPLETKSLEHQTSSLIRDLQQAASNKSVLPPIQNSAKDYLAVAWTEINNKGIEENEKCAEEEQEKTTVSDRDNSDPVFMTQFSDVDEKHFVPTKNKINIMDKKQSKKIQTPQDDNRGSVVAADDRYEGYELLLNVDELDNEPELPPARDIQGNIRALKYTLNHLLVYRDPAVELSKIQKMVPEYRRIPMPPPAKPVQTYQEKVDDVLSKLKTRSTIEEENLSTVLKSKDKFHKQFPEAEMLLGRVQRRFNTVRYHLIMDAKQAGDIAANVLELLPPAKIK